jgi:hypothetical protein
MLRVRSVTIDEFWLMAEFIAHFDTACDLTLHLTITHTSVHIISSLPLLGSCLQRRTFFFFFQILNWLRLSCQLPK